MEPLHETGFPATFIRRVLKIEQSSPEATRLTLAELIIKATALQEMTNRALRIKGSPYRIAEISISASIPPAVSFAISRIGDEPEEIGSEVVSSSELVEQIVESGDLVLALDGTTVDPSGVVEPPEADGSRRAMPPSGVSSDGS